MDELIKTISCSSSILKTILNFHHRLKFITDQICFGKYYKESEQMAFPEMMDWRTMIQAVQVQVSSSL